MTQPTHYTLELVERCQSLLTHLWPVVKKGLPGDEHFGGVLTTTFLVSLAMPIVTLPLERLEGGAKYRVADENVLDTKVCDAFESGLGRKLKDSEFARLDWRYVTGVDAFNIADGFSKELCEKLRDDRAGAAAQEETLDRQLRVLRNALAHGGVVYLDKDGWQSNESAGMVAFVRSHDADKKKGVSRRFSIVRLSEEDLRGFLYGWCDWLQNIGMIKVGV
jgi:hypothetical protein